MVRKIAILAWTLGEDSHQSATCGPHASGTLHIPRAVEYLQPSYPEQVAFAGGAGMYIYAWYKLRLFVWLSGGGSNLGAATGTFNTQKAFCSHRIPLLLSACVS